MRLSIPAPLRHLSRKLRKIRQFEARNYWYTRPVDPDTVLYEAYAGGGMLCNPEAIFRDLLDDPDFAHLKHIWALRDVKGHPEVTAEFSSHPRVTFVEVHSSRYFHALATSKYLVNNAAFPPAFIKREEQVYLNTWHGTPLKTMGYHAPGGGPDAANVTRNLAAADYLLSSGPYMTERLYEQAYRLINIFSGRIVTEGFPRIDRQSEVDPLAVQQELRRAGTRVRPGARIVLYAPTWRGESSRSPVNDVEALGRRVRELSALLPDDLQVLLKVHQHVHEYAVEHPDLDGVLVPHHLPTNQVLGVTDVLVTDYSSIFFDFLATERPIVFFTPDRSDYERERGVYLSTDELPGPTTATVAELAQLVRASGTGDADDPLLTHADAYKVARKRFVPRDDGHATGRIINAVFRGQAQGLDVKPISRDGRPRILVYAGGLRPNGITASVMNLLANLDYTRFDVSVFYNAALARDARPNAAAIPEPVRLIPRLGGITPSQLLRRHRRKLQEVGIDARGLNLRAMDRVFTDEWRRCFGDSEFDHIVDFSGYAPFWSFLLSKGKARERAIWMHSDMRADQVRNVEGHKPHESNLRAVFSTYALYDHLVSVSPSLAEVNAERLALPDGDARFTFARNTLNQRRIQRLAYGSAAAHSALTEALTSLDGDLATTMEALAAHYGLSTVQDELSRLRTIEAVIPPMPGTFTFVAVGRLSPEKNYERLIRAFHVLHQSHPDTRLIILGGGPLEASLRGLCAELGLKGVVTLAGQQSNPYVVMARSDCLVLSSNYEGQPMVFLEALTVGIPVVTTRFPSVRDSLPEGTGLVVPQTVDGLAEGMAAALRGEVPNPPFDADAYNREAVQEFYRAIGVEA